jgi:hypothetical protein
MDKMSLFSVLAISLPEAVLNIYLSFLITGEKTHLYLDDRINIIRLCIAAPLMAVATYTVRAVMPNVNFILLVNILVYIIIIRFVYNMKFFKAFINVIVFMGYLISFEVIFTPVFFQIAGINASQLLSNDSLRFLYAVFEKVPEIFIIISLWNWNKASFNIKEYKETKAIFSIFIMVLIMTEAIFCFIFVYNLDKIPMVFRVIFTFGCVLFAVFNFLLFKLISVLTNAVAKKEITQSMEYKKETRNSFTDIYSSLEDGDIERAKRICEHSLK